MKTAIYNISSIWQYVTTLRFPCSGHVIWCHRLGQPAGLNAIGLLGHTFRAGILYTIGKQSPWLDNNHLILAIFILDFGRRLNLEENYTGESHDTAWVSTHPFLTLYTSFSLLFLITPLSPFPVTSVLEVLRLTNRNHRNLAMVGNSPFVMSARTRSGEGTLYLRAVVGPASIRALRGCRGRNFQEIGFTRYYQNTRLLEKNAALLIRALRLLPTLTRFRASFYIRVVHLCVVVQRLQVIILIYITLEVTHFIL